MKSQKINSLMGLVFIFILTAAFLQTCKKDEKEYKYINLGDFFPYLTKGFEENFLRFAKKDKTGSKYILEGVETFTHIFPRTWAVEKQTLLTVYFSELENKTVVLKCKPFNPPNQPSQEGDIYVNDHFLQKIKLTDKGEYTLHIPANLLNYGSNHIRFDWKYLRSPKDFGVSEDKRKYAAGFFYLKYRNKYRQTERRNKPVKITLSKTKNISKINIPRRGIIEYFVELPQKPTLGFKLSAKGNFSGDSKLHAAITNEKGEKIIHHFKKEQLNSKKEHRLDLGKFEKETVRIVFANSAGNHPKFTVSLLNPTIYSSSKDLPALFKTDYGKIGKKRHQAKNNRKPHVFIYLIDTLRADHMSCYGYHRETTPYIDQFSKSSILFKNCFSTATWTKPAVGSILTGLYPNKHRAEDRKDKLAADVMMISEVLKSRGYTTIYITPNVNVDANFNFIQGIDFYKFSIQKPHKRSHYRSSEYLNEDFSKIIENNPGLRDKPIFAFLHTVDPHDPYTPKPPFLKFKKNGAGRGKLAYPVNIGIKKAEGGLSREDIDFIKSLYDCEILHNDYYFGKWIEYLKEKNLYENAIIILVADHGEQFDEHDNFFHGQSVYNEEAHVPLIIKLPYGEFPGTQTDIFVSQVDLYPTILGYLGIEIPSVVDGVSLLDILKRKNLRRPVFIKEEMDGYNFLGMISQNNIKHIITYKDESFIKEINIEQYNLVKDFRERTDMFERKNPFHARFVKFSADYFLTEMEKQAFKEEKEVDLNKLDPEKIEQLKALGYLK